jgi:hypothetical protein
VTEVDHDLIKTKVVQPATNLNAQVLVAAPTAACAFSKTIE